MGIKFVSKDIEWTEPMKECVRQRITHPLLKRIKDDVFELSVHLERYGPRPGWSPRFAMWVVLRTFDGNNNEVARREGDDFHHLTNDVSCGLRRELLPLL